MAGDAPIEVTIPNIEDVLAKLDGKKFWAAMKARMAEASQIVEREAKKQAPVDMGKLHASITSEVREAGSQIIGVIGTNVEYAPYQEMGFSRHFVPASIIGVWAERHGFGYTGLMVSGEPKRFLQGAAEDKMGTVQDVLRKVLDDIAKVAGG